MTNNGENDKKFENFIFIIQYTEYSALVEENNDNFQISLARAMISLIKIFTFVLEKVS